MARNAEALRAVLGRAPPPGRRPPSAASMAPCFNACRPRSRDRAETAETLYGHTHTHTHTAQQAAFHAYRSPHHKSQLTTLNRLASDVSRCGALRAQARGARPHLDGLAERPASRLRADAKDAGTRSVPVRRRRKDNEHQMRTAGAVMGADSLDRNVRMTPKNGPERPDCERARRRPLRPEARGRAGKFATQHGEAPPLNHARLPD